MKVEYSGIKKTINRLERLKKKYTINFHQILDEIAQAGFQIASSEYAQNTNYAGDPKVDVNIVWESEYTVSVVASGSSVMFIEFGSGTNWWQSPYADTFPEVVGLGKYGAGHGDSSKYPHGWVYRGEEGTGGLAYPVKRRRKDGTEVEIPGVWRTWGNPPANAMYHASQKMHEKVERIIERGIK